MQFIVLIFVMIINTTIKGVAIFYAWNSVLVPLTSFKPMSGRDIFGLMILYMLFNSKLNFKMENSKK